MIKHYVVVDMRAKRAQEYQQAGNFPLSIDASTRGVFAFDTAPDNTRIWKSVEEMAPINLQVAFSTYTASGE